MIYVIFGIFVASLLESHAGDHHIYTHGVRMGERESASEMSASEMRAKVKVF
jgi:hypothetical protein